MFNSEGNLQNISVINNEPMSNFKFKKKSCGTNDLKCYNSMQCCDLNLYL